MEEQMMVSYRDAMNQAFREEMRRDNKIRIWGVDVAGDFGINATVGIKEEFGDERIIDTPIAEEAIIATAVGAGFAGFRPVAILMHAPFVALTLDAIFMKLGCISQEWGYKPPPVVVFAVITSGGGSGADFAFSPEALAMHSPGLNVVLPSSPSDAKGLLKSALRSDSPVVFLPHITLFNNKEKLSTAEYTIPLGKASIKKTGKDLTIVGYSAMINKALAAAEILSKTGIEVEVIDLRSVVPLDIQTVVDSVKKTGRLLVIHETYKRGGPAGEIITRFLEAAPDLVKVMKSPIKRLASPNIAFPHSLEIEEQLIPSVNNIVTTVQELIKP